MGAPRLLSAQPGLAVRTDSLFSSTAELAHKRLYLLLLPPLRPRSAPKHAPTHDSCKTALKATISFPSNPNAISHDSFFGSSFTHLLGPQLPTLSHLSAGPPEGADHFFYSCFLNTGVL